MIIAGLLSSTAVIKLGLFEKMLAGTGVTLVIPKDQTVLMEVIKAVKRGDMGKTTRQLFINIATNVLKDRVDILLIACSELSLLTDGFDQAIPYFDTLDLLAKEIVLFGLNGNGEAFPDAVSRWAR